MHARSMDDFGIENFVKIENWKVRQQINSDFIQKNYFFSIRSID